MVAVRTQVFSQVFAELGGLVLYDLGGLRAFHGGDLRGANLLEQYTESVVGDRVCRVGAAIPLMDLEPANYTVLIRGRGGDELLGPDAKVRSSGWVLRASAGELRLCGAGHLTRFDPETPAHRRINVPAGWYNVEVLGGVLAAGTPAEMWVYEFSLQPSETPPLFSADLKQALGLPVRATVSPDRS